MVRFTSQSWTGPFSRVPRRDFCGFPGGCQAEVAVVEILAKKGGEKMVIHFHRNVEWERISLHVRVPIPFGHGWELSYIVHLAAFYRETYGLVEAALITPKGSVKLL